MRSVEILQIKISKLLKSEYLVKNIQFRGSLRKFPINSNIVSPDIIDLVLFGEGPGLFSDEMFWPHQQNYRIWVICNAAKKILTDLIGFEKEEVGFINRYDLFQHKSIRKQTPGLRQLVYAGRDGQQKNLELLITLFKKYQYEFDDHRLVICSPKLEKKTLEAINTQDWKYRPIFLGDLKDDWVHLKLRNPSFISLSNYKFEDFSVAAALAQSKNWPVLVPSWYGFKDIIGAHFFKSTFGKNHEDDFQSFVDCLKPQTSISSLVLPPTLLPINMSSHQIKLKIRAMKPRAKAQLFNYFNPSHLPNVPFDSSLTPLAYDLIYPILES